MPLIPVKANGERVVFSVVDANGYVRAMSLSRSWRLNANGYAVSEMRKGGVRIKFMLHRIIAGTPKGMATDHINGYRLDNRGCNLRVCTTQQNSWNMGIGKRNGKRFKGVFWHKSNKRWSAIIVKDYKAKHLGYADTEKEAAAMYDRAAMLAFGSYAKLNGVLNA